jgi:hypothetical protein
MSAGQHQEICLAGDLRDAIVKAGCQAVIKPKPVRPAVEGGFSVDEAQRMVTCPGRAHRRFEPHPRGHLRGAVFSFQFGRRGHRLVRTAYLPG